MESLRHSFHSLLLPSPLAEINDTTSWDMDHGGRDTGLQGERRRANPHPSPGVAMNVSRVQNVTLVEGQARERGQSKCTTCCSERGAPLPYTSNQDGLDSGTDEPCENRHHPPPTLTFDLIRRPLTFCKMLSHALAGLNPHLQRVHKASSPHLFTSKLPGFFPIKFSSCRSCSSMSVAEKFVKEGVVPDVIATAPSNTAQV